MRDAKIIEKAGVFSIVLECVASDLSKKITKEAKIPTIGIGSSVHCDGQVLVTDDLIGLYADFTPKFVKKYANVQDIIQKAAQAYSADVISQKFPDKSHCFWPDKK